MASLPLTYARVYLSLSDILANPFFTTYIKTGNILLLSQGRPLVDNRLWLIDGILTLELDRATYEKCGLQGTPMEDGGRKHMKQRWKIVMNLRAPGMLHGKKGFGRLEWAAKNVLNQSLTWLFYDLARKKESQAAMMDERPIEKHAPKWVTVLMQVRKMENVRVPRLTVGDIPGLYQDGESSSTLLEYLHMLVLGSSRLEAGDNIDPLLARYDVPSFGTTTETRDMVRVRWQGLLPMRFIRELFVMLRREGYKVDKGNHDGLGGTQELAESRWFAMTGHGFGRGEQWTAMQYAGRETLVWEPPR